MCRIPKTLHLVRKKVTNSFLSTSDIHINTFFMMPSTANPLNWPPVAKAKNLSIRLVYIQSNKGRNRLPTPGGYSSSSLCLKHPHLGLVFTYGSHFTHLPFICKNSSGAGTLKLGNGREHSQGVGHITGANIEGNIRDYLMSAGFTSCL